MTKEHTHYYSAKELRSGVKAGIIRILESDNEKHNQWPYLVIGTSFLEPNRIKDAYNLYRNESICLRDFLTDWIERTGEEPKKKSWPEPTTIAYAKVRLGNVIKTKKKPVDLFSFWDNKKDDVWNNYKSEVKKNKKLKRKNRRLKTKLDRIEEARSISAKIPEELVLED